MAKMAEKQTSASGSVALAKISAESAASKRNNGENENISGGEA